MVQSTLAPTVFYNKDCIFKKHYIIIKTSVIGTCIIVRLFTYASQPSERYYKLYFDQLVVMEVGKHYELQRTLTSEIQNDNKDLETGSNWDERQVYVCRAHVTVYNAFTASIAQCLQISFTAACKRGLSVTDNSYVSEESKLRIHTINVVRLSLTFSICKRNHCEMHHQVRENKWSVCH